MENKSHALLAGIFVLILMVAAAAAAIWIGRKNITYESFELLSRLPVGGLSIQSQVRYQGMSVGQVQGLAIDPNLPGVIRIRIGVVPETPVTKSTWAEISTQGVTGISNIDLRDDGSDPVRVVSRPDDLYEIPVRPGFLQKLQKSGVGMLEDAERVLNALEVFVTEDNAEVFGQILKNTLAMTDSATQTFKALDPTLKVLPELVKRMDGMVGKVDALADEMTALSRSARQTVALLNSPSGPLQQAAASLDQLQRSAAQLQTSTLPEVNRMIENISQASRSLTATVRLFETAPQSVLFGAPTPRPGPGEPGFAGFGKDVAP